MSLEVRLVLCVGQFAVLYAWAVAVLDSVPQLLAVVSVVVFAACLSPVAQPGPAVARAMPEETVRVAMRVVRSWIIVVLLVGKLCRG